MTWRTVQSETLLDTPFVCVKKDSVITDTNITISDFYTVSLADAVAIAALTADHQIILKKEYRYSRNRETIELPAGMIEKNDTDPLTAAKRELLEETGYESDRWTYIGPTIENSSKLTNTMHLYIAENCIKTAIQNLDQTEDISVILMDLEKAVEMVMGNQIACNSSAHAILYTARKIQNI